MSVMDPPVDRPRSKSIAYSFKSSKSTSSRVSNKNNKTKANRRETAEEKHRSYLSATGKANPNAAMIEAQPVAAALEAPTMGSLRAIQHVDAAGQPIAEPDLSNPTRPRWERPLDTIRSFEAAIDGEYKRRSQQRPLTGIFSDSGVGYGVQSRRSSYMGFDNYNTGYSTVGSQGGYYNRNRDSFVENGAYGYGPQGQMSRMSHIRRQYTEPVAGRFANYNNNENVYPGPGYQRSRDTVNTNGSSEPWANSTDPSSENSSIDRTNVISRDFGDQQQYGYPGPSNRPIMEEEPYGNGYGGQQQTYRADLLSSLPPAGNAAPPVPPHEHSGNAIPQPGQAQRLMKAGAQHAPRPVANTAGGYGPPASNTKEKKSWLKRTFSKNGR